MRFASASSPGRLDFMGGVADYSGSWVLEMPTRVQTTVSLFAQEKPLLTFKSDSEVSLCAEEFFEMPIRRRAGEGELVALLRDVRVPPWVRYPLGCLLLGAMRKGWKLRGGLVVRIRSKVPISMGVSSSAALEVATLRALTKLAGWKWKGTELARLAQEVENRLVGAPCGLMDQLAVQHGKASALLPILCRPDLLGDNVSLPSGVLVVGWPSGVHHDVGASPYGIARASAFMGKKILEKNHGLKTQFLSEVPPSVFALYDLPVSLRGADFLKKFKNTDDLLTAISPAQKYPVFAATEFPIRESARCREAMLLLKGLRPETRTPVMESVGELMFQSHAAYSRMGLGSEETDEMVGTIRALGVKKGLYGARVSGGGSGGTVVVLLEKKALPSLRRLASRLFFSKAGPLPLIF